MSASLVAAQVDQAEVVAAMAFLALTVVACLVSRGRPTMIVRGGLPFCACCGRQVSRRRSHCRTCGNPNYSRSRRDGARGSSLAIDDAERERRSKALGAFRAARAAERERRLEADRERAAERKAASDSAYRAMGVEPGPLAWYRALPDWQRLTLLGLAVSAPLVAALALILSRAIKP